MSINATEYLKPCPFCKGDPAIYDDDGGFVVECPSCICEMSHCSYDYLIDSWNRRNK